MNAFAFFIDSIKFATGTWWVAMVDGLLQFLEDNMAQEETDSAVPKKSRKNQQLSLDKSFVLFREQVPDFPSEPAWWCLLANVMFGCSMAKRLWTLCI